jgi:hypothetical protein
LYAFIISSMRATCSHLIVLYLNTLTIFGRVQIKRNIFVGR